MGAPKKFCGCNNPSCTVDERLTKTSDLLGTSMGGAALILSALKAMSDGPFPPLKAASGTLLVILELFQVRVSYLQAPSDAMLSRSP